MCQNNTLEDLVRSVLQSFIKDEVLFTALDVSNKVKETMPLARHREVRDIVRSCWSSEIDPAGYGRSPITVTLSDGTTAEALLYHSLADSWDLDAKYDAQKRAQVAVKPQQTSAPVAVTIGNQTASVSADGTLVITPVKLPPSAVTAPVATPTQTVPVVTTNVRDLWDQMFKTQPSLFPRQNDKS